MAACGRAAFVWPPIPAPFQRKGFGAGDQAGTVPNIRGTELLQLKSESEEASSVGARRRLSGVGSPRLPTPDSRLPTHFNVRLMYGGPEHGPS